MEIIEQKQNDIDIVVLSGRFVMENSHEIRDRIVNVIAKGQGKLLINMENVTFIDSNGFAVLVAVYKELQSISGHLVFVVSPVVQSLLELTRLHTIFEIMPNQSIALQNLT